MASTQIILSNLLSSARVGHSYHTFFSISNEFYFSIFSQTEYYLVNLVGGLYRADLGHLD